MIPTTKRVEVPDYPYGFKLRTTLYDWVEFTPKKGYRHCTATINPKTGKLNAPKRGRYYPLIVRYFDGNGHIKTHHFSINGDAEINRAARFIHGNFDLFLPEEINYLYNIMLAMSYLDFKATCIYGGSDPSVLRPLYNDFFNNCKAGIESGENLFALMQLDSEAIDKTKS
jgi:hypothetical protein